jgi:hypothetical protein
LKGGRVETLLDFAEGVGRAPTSALSKSEKDALREAAREIWYKTTGRRGQWDQLQIHHRVPLEWAHLMPGDPNRLANLIGVSKAGHEMISAEWVRWKAALGGRQPTSVEIMKEVLRIDEACATYMVFPK